MRIIPCPKDFTKKDGSFLFDAETGFSCDYENVGNSISSFLKTYGIGWRTGDDIKFTSDGSDSSSEAYTLVVGEDGVKVSAKSERGLFYGAQTLKQLILSSFDEKTKTAEIPCCEINDEPRFSYRGYMFDTVRHFFPVEVVKKYIEAISLLKLNVFHWHLSDDQGWRVQIDKYPRLTEHGSMRRETCGDKKPHGGFYTKEQIKDVVEFAKERFITVIPEFDIPGHTRAAVSSYPELGCSKKPVEVSTKFGIHSEILCAGKEESYDFVKGVLKEFAEMFPSEYIHIGGDEAVKHEWYKCKDCQKKMKELGLRNEEELQAYFTEKAVEYLKSLNKTTICWNESANSGKLESSVILQFWQDGKENENVIREVKNGRKIIVSKFNPYYLDYPYPMHSLKAAYEFEPVFHGIEGYEQNVLGVESPLWTEWIDNTDLLAFRVFPRLTAVAESAWCDKSKKDYLAFENSLKNVNKLIENTTGIKAAPLKDCNVKNPLKRAAIMMKFGMNLIDFEMIARSNRAAKEMKKMRSVRKKENNGK